MSLFGGGALVAMARETCFRLCTCCHFAFSYVAYVIGGVFAHMLSELIFIDDTHSELLAPFVF